MQTNQFDPRLPWHQPAIRRLAVNMDTQGQKAQVLKVGSFVDGQELPTTVEPDGF